MSTLAVGTTVADRYTIVSPLAEGGMGSVYVATDQKFDLNVALKITTPRAGANGVSEVAERFKREAKIGNKLGRYEGIVRSFDWGKLPDGKLYMAMDLVENARDLDVRAGSLTERVEAIVAAASILSWVHASGVIHRDVKPQNFLVDPAGQVYLTDFGIAKVAGEPDDASDAQLDLTLANVAIGTPYYMAPEQFEDARSVDARADVYAVGVMLYLALVGDFPYKGKSASQIAATQMKVRYDGSEPPRVRAKFPLIPRALDDVIDRAMSVKPEDRFASIDELLQSLEAVEWRKSLAGLVPPRANRATGTRRRPPEQERGTVAMTGEEHTLADDAIREGNTLVDTPEQTLHAERDRTGQLRDLDPDPTQHPGYGVGSTRRDTGRGGCPSCGYDRLQSDVCPKCQTNVREYRLREMRERRAASGIHLSGSSGAGVDYGGFQIPKVAWFFLGILVVLGLVFQLGGSEPSDKPPRDRTGEDGGGDATDEGEDGDAESDEVDPETLEGDDAYAFEVFIELHQIWRDLYERDSDLPEADREREVERALSDPYVFESYDLRLDARGDPATIARTPTLLFKTNAQGEYQVTRR